MNAGASVPDGEAATGAGATFDATSDDVVQCPYPHYKVMRDEAPVLELDGAMFGRPDERIFAISRYDDVKRILHDPLTFSSRFGTPAFKPSAELVARLKDVQAEGWPNVSTMLTEDPPSHTRYRRLVSMAFTPKRVALLEPEIRRVCDELVAGFARRSRIDFLEQFAVPLPVAAVALILEIPDSHREEFKRWADSSVAAIGKPISDDERVAAERDIVAQQQYFASEIEARRTEPRDDFLTDLLNAELPADDAAAAGLRSGPLTMAEMLSIIRQIQVAGSETTTSLLADLMVLLAEDPDQWERLKADPDRAGVIVEEGLRWASPNQGLYRIVTSDTEVAGTSIPQGSTVWLMYGSADHDERVFADPESFDPDRDGVRNHIAFGHGIHHCLGAALARLEAVTALQVLAASIDTISVVDRAALRYGGSFILRGLEHLELDVTYR